MLLLLTLLLVQVKPRQQQQQQLGLGEDARAGGAAMHYNRMAVPSPPGSMPPSHLPPSVQPWAFMPDRSSPMYNPYSGLNQQVGSRIIYLLLAPSNLTLHSCS